MNKRKHRKLFKKKWLLKRAKKLIRKKKSTFSGGGSEIFDTLGSQRTENVVSFLVKKNFTKKVRCKSKVVIYMPHTFSFVIEPDTALRYIKRIVYYITKNSVENLYIYHTTIKQISLTASLMLDIILMNAESYIKSNRFRKSLNLSGEVEKNTDIGILIHANGVLPHLGFSVKKNADVETLDIIFGTKDTSSTQDPASEILLYFSKCLSRQGCTLTIDGKRQFSKFLGEVIDNCRIHAGEDVRWYALGFYHHKEGLGKCHIAMLSLGDTIYESLSIRNNVTNEIYQLLKNKTNEHEGYFGNKWNEEALWTWLSLQHGVSRLRDQSIVDQMNRGQGTIDMMESFQTIGKSTHGEKPQFSIISGNTFILFDFDKYPLIEIEINGENRKIITFNKQNSLLYPPDFNNIKILQNKFPGTVYTMEFYIDPQFIENSNQGYVRRI